MDAVANLQLGFGRRAQEVPLAVTCADFAVAPAIERRAAAKHGHDKVNVRATHNVQGLLLLRQWLEPREEGPKISVSARDVTSKVLISVSARDVTSKVLSVLCAISCYGHG